MKERRISKTALVLEFIIWFAGLTFGILGLVFNFMNGKVFAGVVYSILTLMALAGLIFNIVYIVKHLGDDPNLPKE